MTVKRVFRFPDPILKMPCLEVVGITPSVEGMVTDLVDTMRASPACVGLAAPQIGIPYRAFVVDVTGHRKAAACHGPVILLNPEILESSDPEVAREGCMSVPDLTGDVGRPSSLLVRGMTLQGDERLIETDAFEARAILHEIDHLDGRLFLDRVQSHGSVFPRKVYR
jgi:peptide deformylase